MDWREESPERERERERKRPSPSRGGKGPEPGLWEPKDTPCPVIKPGLAPRSPGAAPLSSLFRAGYGRISPGAVAVGGSLSSASWKEGSFYFVIFL